MSDVTKPLVEGSEETRGILEMMQDPIYLPHYDDITQILKGLTDERGDSHSYISKGYELLSIELVDDIATLLVGLPSFDPDAPIVEICAGNGRLSYHLGQRGIKIIATDDYSRKTDRMDIVEELNHQAAIEKYDPSIVLASWMPPIKPIDVDVLRYPGIEHLVHIGDQDPCGTIDRYFISDNYVSEEAGRHLIKSKRRYPSTIEVFEYNANKDWIRRLPASKCLDEEVNQYLSDLGINVSYDEFCPHMGAEEFSISSGGVSLYYKFDAARRHPPSFYFKEQAEAHRQFLEISQEQLDRARSFVYDHTEDLDSTERSESVLPRALANLQRYISRTGKSLSLMVRKQMSFKSYLQQRSQTAENTALAFDALQEAFQDGSVFFQSILDTYKPKHPETLSNIQACTDLAKDLSITYRNLHDASLNTHRYFQQKLQFFYSVGT